MAFPLSQLVPMTHTGVFGYGMPVPENTVGMIIGAKGATINLIKRNTGAHVQIQKGPGSWFMITGFPHQIRAAYDFMANIVKNATERDQTRFMSRQNGQPMWAAQTMDDAFPSLPTSTGSYAAETKTESQIPSQQEIDNDMGEFFAEMDASYAEEGRLFHKCVEAQHEADDEWGSGADQEDYPGNPMHQWVVEDQMHVLRAAAGEHYVGLEKYSDENLERSIKHFNDNGHFFVSGFTADGEPIPA